MDRFGLGWWLRSSMRLLELIETILVEIRDLPSSSSPVKAVNSVTAWFQSMTMSSVNDTNVIRSGPCQWRNEDSSNESTLPVRLVELFPESPCVGLGQREEREREREYYGRTAGCCIAARFVADDLLHT